MKDDVVPVERLQTTGLGGWTVSCSSGRSPSKLARALGAVVLPTGMPESSSAAFVDDAVASSFELGAAAALFEEGSKAQPLHDGYSSPFFDDCSHEPARYHSSGVQFISSKDSRQGSFVVAHPLESAHHRQTFSIVALRHVQFRGQPEMVTWCSNPGCASACGPSDGREIAFDGRDYGNHSGARTLVHGLRSP